MALSGTVGSYTDYAYTGGVQAVTVPVAGIYKLECWGAGSYGSNGAKGGYSLGYKQLNAGDKLYVVVGGKGTNTAAGGYNGGGGASGVGDYEGKCSSGGGATHIATQSGTLRALAAKTYVLLVAGGAGGGSAANTGEAYLERVGGAGGGVAGNNGTYYSSVTEEGSYGCGGTQKAGYGFGYGGYGIKRGESTGGVGGGGGGLYGGYSGYFSDGTDEVCGAGGGSGYIDGCPTITLNGKTYAAKTTAGGGSAIGEHGKARITLQATTEKPVYFDGTGVTEVYFNGTKLDHLIYGGTTIFARAVRRCCAWVCRFTGIASKSHRVIPDA